MNEFSVVTHMQEVTRVTVSAFQEVRVPLLGQKARNVVWNPNVKAVQDGQDQLWPKSIHRHNV